MKKLFYLMIVAMTTMMVLGSCHKLHEDDVVMSRNSVEYVINN